MLFLDEVQAKNEAKLTLTEGVLQKARLQREAVGAGGSGVGWGFLPCGVALSWGDSVAVRAQC